MIDRHGHAVPTTRHQADARFSCAPHRCDMAGRACAERWAAAREADAQGLTQLPTRHKGQSLKVQVGHCVGCESGEARHRLGAHLRPAVLTPVLTEEVQTMPNAVDKTLDYLRAWGPATSDEIAAALGYAPGTIINALATLQREGAVARSAVNGGFMYVARKGVTAEPTPAEPAAPSTLAKPKPPAPAPSAPAPDDDCDGDTDEPPHAPPPPEPTMPDPRWEPGGPGAPDPLPVGPPSEPAPPVDPEPPPAAAAGQAQPRAGANDDCDGKIDVTHLSFAAIFSGTGGLANRLVTPKPGVSSEVDEARAKVEKAHDRYEIEAAALFEVVADVQSFFDEHDQIAQDAALRIIRARADTAIDALRDLRIAATRYHQTRAVAIGNAFQVDFSGVGGDRAKPRAA